MAVSECAVASSQRTIAVLRSSENEPVAEFSRHGARPVVLAQGVTRYYWNGPAVHHPGYARRVAGAD
jgi:hypothetical protein